MYNSDTMWSVNFDDGNFIVKSVLILTPWSSENKFERATIKIGGYECGKFPVKPPNSKWYKVDCKSSPTTKGNKISINGINGPLTVSEVIVFGFPDSRRLLD